MTTIKILGDVRPMRRDFNRLARKDVPRVARNALDRLARRIYTDSTKTAATMLAVPVGAIRGSGRGATGHRRRARAIYYRPGLRRPSALIRAYFRPISYGELGGLVTAGGRLRKGIAGAAKGGQVKGRQVLSKPFAATMPSGRTGLFVRVAPKTRRTKRQRARRLPIAELTIPVVPVLPAAIEARLARADSREWSTVFGEAYQRTIRR